MSQSSFLSPENPPAQGVETGRRVQVLVPGPLGRAYDYVLPEGMAAQAGDYVSVPFGKRDTAAVVWADTGGDDAIDPAKLKSLRHVYKTCPPMPDVHRQFIERVARYTMADLGSVLKMSLSAPDALTPPKSAPALTLGDISDTAPRKHTAHRQKIIEFLSDGVPRRASEIAAAAGCTPAVVRAMAAAGILKPASVAAPVPCRMVDLTSSALAFTDAQKDAAEALKHTVAQQKFAAMLLDGVTGSGKTEVYFEAVAAALAQGKQALILLPEISLSAQFMERFTRRFGTAPAIWHSEVPAAQRRLVWQGAADGRTRVVIGARSALFLPFADLGVIVVDEEHDASYKQEEGVMYHARDMAVLRARLGDIACVLVSATPSLETMTNVQAGKYAYLHLPSRFGGATLPAMQVVDLRRDAPPRQKFISPPLIDALRTTIEAGEQSLLFLNRRGYAPLTLCRTCGHRFQCPSCTAWLVEHRRHGRLQCHHCGFGQKMPAACPSCNDEGSFAACGPGVERIQEEVQELLPDARTLVLASDITGSANMIRSAITQIEKQEVDIIIGTQIVAKGHHFPALTLVGVVDADLGLSGGDLRAGERTFQLLQQVSGRAGRGDKPGRVFLQTYMPEQNVIRALAAGDRDAFLAAEGRERERAGMPPFGKLAALILQSTDEMKLDQFCRALAQRAPRYDDIRVLGPAPAPMAFLRGKHRRRFLIRSGRDINMQNYLSEWLGGIKTGTSIQMKIDIDPQSFF
ncbi:MAG TPA: primosomal protein N' [Alphaproteobacteria bacterium]|nr:primosomal protein N' [Alphaproteobacteria bacterium]